MLGFDTARNHLKAGLACALGLTLAGCALSPFDEDGFLRKTTTTVGVTGKLAEPQEFVRESRTGKEEYPPVGVTPPAPAVPVRPSYGVSALENELNALRQRNEQVTSAPRPPSPYDGKIEPGYKPPPPAPLPEYTGPRVEAPGSASTAAAAPPATAGKPKAKPAKSTKRKPNDKKTPAQ